MKLTVVIVSYNVRYYLEQCIASVLKATEGLESQIYVVDNNSKDGTVGFLSHRFGSLIHIVDSNHNLGFARANNIAIRQTESDYVLLLNPDTFVSETSIRQMLDFMDAHPQAGGVGVRMHNSDGTLARESRRGLPTPWVSLLKMFGFSRRYYMSDLSWDVPGRIDIMSGACCMLRRKVLDKIGLLDEDFFMYGEDIDLSYRVLKGGYENWYLPVDIVHYKGESTVKTSYRYVHVFYDAMLIFFRKHYGHLSFFVTAPIKLAIYFRAFIALIKMQYTRMRESLGFAHNGHSDTHYIFVGNKRLQSEGRKLADRKGLTASYCDQLNPDVLKEGMCVVYNADTLSYAEIISRHASLAKPRVCMGTYSSKTKTLITPFEIVR